jgi:SAM-dependent methyltransferase
MHFWYRTRQGLARWLSLDLTHSQTRYADFLRRRVHPGIRWLEVGCGRWLLPTWALSQDEQRELATGSFLVGLDVDNAMLEHPLLSARVMGLGGTSPFRPETFDLVTANMVVEHVDKCSQFLDDIFQILRPGGRFLFHTPNLSNYLVAIASKTPDFLKDSIVQVLEQRKEEDRFYTHYHMNTVADIQRLAPAAGFQVEELQVVGSVGSFGSLGPVGLLECFPMKAAQSLSGGKYQSNLLCCLRKPLKS